jgi:hypothetical protein
MDAGACWVECPWRGKAVSDNAMRDNTRSTRDREDTN